METSRARFVDPRSVSLGDLRSSLARHGAASGIMISKICPYIWQEKCSIYRNTSRAYRLDDSMSVNAEARLLPSVRLTSLRLSSQKRIPQSACFFDTSEKRIVLLDEEHSLEHPMGGTNERDFVDGNFEVRGYLQKQGRQHWFKITLSVRANTSEGLIVNAHDPRPTRQSFTARGIEFCRQLTRHAMFGWIIERMKEMFLWVGASVLFKR